MLSPRMPNPSVASSKLELVFVHLDPVLSVHLARQKMSLMGRGVIEFIHPAERERESSLGDMRGLALELIWFRGEEGLDERDCCG